MRNGMAAVAAAREPTRVLVVDDDPLWREAVSLVLGIEGMDVDAAANGADALRRLRRGPPPDVVLTDLAMPVMSGWQLRAALLRDPVLAALPVVVVSGEDDTRLVRADRCLRKGCDPDELLEAIRAVVH